MTDHMQNAIAAFKEAREQANQSQLKPEGYRTEAGLRAAEPHIRAMITQEILDHVDDIPLNGLPYYRDGIYAGMVSAALLVRGPQQ